MKKVCWDIIHLLSLIEQVNKKPYREEFPRLLDRVLPHARGGAHLRVISSIATAEIHTGVSPKRMKAVHANLHARA